MEWTAIPTVAASRPPQPARAAELTRVIPTSTRAWLAPGYGSPDRLELMHIETPMPAAGQVLVRVRSASVNALDWHRLRGQPYAIRVTDGLRRPKVPAIGADFAGIVEAVGDDVTDLRTGDEVFGMSVGTFAEHVRVKAEGVIPKPVNLTFEEAAAIPVAAITALQGLRDKGRIRAGQRVLVMGAGGGVGTFAVQIAKSFDTTVTAVTSTPNMDIARSLGADAVVDYTREDVTRQRDRHDLIFDASGHRSLSDLRRVLTPDGTLVICGAGRGDWIGPFLRPVAGVVLSKLSSQRFAPFLSHRDHDDLLALRDLAERGAIRPVIDRRFGFAEIPAAIRYLETGQAHGKVVVTLP